MIGIDSGTRKCADFLIGWQVTDKDKKAIGSWPKDQGHIGSMCGRLGTTAFALLTLEIYYRNSSIPGVSVDEEQLKKAIDEQLKRLPKR